MASHHAMQEAFRRPRMQMGCSLPFFLYTDKKTELGQGREESHGPVPDLRLFDTPCSMKLHPAETSPLSKPHFPRIRP